MAEVSRLGGAVALLARRDSLSTTASSGNPRKVGGGYRKSPLAGSMLGAGQLNNLNLPKNDTVNPLGESPDAQDALVVSLPTASLIAVTVAELSTFDPGSPGGGSGDGGGGAAGTGDGGAPGGNSGAPSGGGDDGSPGSF